MSVDVERRIEQAPLVSVVIPTCNRRAMLEKCLSALRRQTYPNYELIVVDDCSTDDTAQFLRDFAACHPQLRLRTLRNASHAGANPSRNRGVREARGEFMAFLDNDCIAEVDWLANLMRGFSGERVAAVSGLVVDAPPRNIYELTVKGTHRLHRAGSAHRLVAGNMCIHRRLLLEYGLDEDRATPLTDRQGRPDIAISGRGDEEGLFLMLRAAGYEQRIAPEAVVVHDHSLDRRTFLRQAFRGGRSAARLAYKFCLPPRLDMAPFLLTYLTLPLTALHWWLLAVSLLFFGAALAAITYNDLVRKGKTLGEAARSFPMLLVYYHLRLGGYVLEALRLRLTPHSLQRVRLNKVARVTPKDSMTQPPKNQPHGLLPDLNVVAETGELRRSSVRGAAVMLVAQGAKLVLTIGSTVVLARLLTPTDFGLLAMVMAITNFVGRFRDLGLTTATVQRAEVRHEQISTLFWINLGFGGALALLTAVAAPAIAWAYAEPRLTLIALALAGMFVFSGAAAQHQALLRREMRFTALALIEAGALLCAIIAAVLAALSRLDYWALVILQVSNAAALAAGVWIACRWRPSLPARGTGVRPFLSFGGNLAAAQVLDAAKSSVQQFLLGRFCGAGPLGFFSRGNYLLLAPVQQLNQPVSSVAIPALSRLQNEPDRFCSFYRWGLQATTLLGMPIAVFLFVAAEPVVLAVLGEQWHETIPIVRALAPAAFVTSSNMATSWLYVAQGQAARQLRWMAFSSSVFVVGAVVGLQWGAIGVAIAASIVICGLRLPGILYCLRTMPVGAADVFGVLWRPATAAAGAGIILYVVNGVFGVSASVFAELGLDLLVFGAAYCAWWLALPGGRRIIRELLKLFPLLRGERSDMAAPEP